MPVTGFACYRSQAALSAAKRFQYKGYLLKKSAEDQAARRPRSRKNPPAAQGRQGRNHRRRRRQKWPRQVDKLAGRLDTRSAQKQIAGLHIHPQPGDSGRHDFQDQKPGGEHRTRPENHRRRPHPDARPPAARLQVHTPGWPGGRSPARGPAPSGQSQFLRPAARRGRPGGPGFRPGCQRALLRAKRQARFQASGDIDQSSCRSCPVIRSSWPRNSRQAVFMAASTAAPSEESL